MNLLRNSELPIRGHKRSESLSKGMKLLVITQTVDSQDLVLGFFCRWIEELAKRVAHIEVICLKEGVHALPHNVRIHSLGKENGVSRFRYLVRFYAYVWKLRYEYDAVFVHMNQEYVLLAGPLWRLLQKRVYLWRNHYAGSLWTDLAAAFCTNVFCTSRYSYTAKYKKTILMPVGVDTEYFKPDDGSARKPYSILFLARMSPSKRPEMLIDALAHLADQKIQYTVSFVGSPLPQDEPYYEALKVRVTALGLSDCVMFHLGVPSSQTPRWYRAHDIFVNASPSGMLDKTIFEAAACGCRVLSSSKDFRESFGRNFYFDSSTTLAERLTAIGLHTRSKETAHILEQNSLSRLGEDIISALQPSSL